MITGVGAMNEIGAIAVIVVAAFVCLSILTLGYWYIMHQDGTILTMTSSIIGGTAGYFAKAFYERYKRRK